MFIESLIFTTDRPTSSILIHSSVSLINHHVIIILSLLLDTGENKKSGKKGKKICLSLRRIHHEIETIWHRD